MPLCHTSRARHLTTSGLGKHYTSPKKLRDKRKSDKIVIPLGQSAKHRLLLHKLNCLRKKPEFGSVPDDPHWEDVTEQAMDPEADLYNALHAPAPPGAPVDIPAVKLSTAASIRLHASWVEILPHLVPPLLHYLSSSVGSVMAPVNDIHSKCSQACAPKRIRILCLYFDHFRYINVTGCKCQTTLYVLVENGLFPTSPSQPRMAVSVDLLDFYRALFERSCDAIMAMTSALHTFYTRRGFHMVSQKGAPLKDPFRRSLGHAVQWYDSLRVSIEKELEAAIEEADGVIEAHLPAVSSLTSQSPSETLPNGIPPYLPQTGETAPQGKNLPNLSPQPLQLPSNAGQCHRILQQRCPACFGLQTWGRPLEEGADVHVGTDGNFSHRHLASAGNGPSYHDPSYILPKTLVDEVGNRIERARQAPTRQYHPSVPDEAVDECEKSYDAAKGNHQADSARFDATGWMSLVCRHDIPLFFVNIDTPGEQQKYSVALLEHLFSLLPPQATVAALYDVGCVLDRSLRMYDILPESVVERLSMATSAMHAYGHQWSCQLVYNPRLVVGLGLSDGEGTERIWSRIRKTIPIERSLWLSRREWLIDRQLTSVGHELRDGLGDWLTHRQNHGIQTQSQAACHTLEDCGFPLTELRHQWKLQRQAQMSIRAHAPTRLKKELNTVLTLQGELDIVDKTLRITKDIIAKSAPTRQSLDLISSLEHTQDRLKQKVEALYASLNVHDTFPELQGVNLEFVRTLLMARDLKINIRKRAIGSFFEWDKLDRAVGGRDETLGTKLHQHTRKAISRRKPALMTAIRKFNKYCETLEKLHDPSWNIPLPLPLSTQLATLRDQPGLMEDVWITPSAGEVPLWLDNQDVRDGIRAMLKQDRCIEETRRLRQEANNISRWLRREVAAVELALHNPSYLHLRVLLQQRRTRLQHLKIRWRSPLIPASVLEQTSDIATVLHKLLGSTWASVPLPPIMVGSSEGLDDDNIPELQAESFPDALESHETCNSEEILIADILQAVPEDVSDVEDTADVECVTFQYHLNWKLPLNIAIDTTLTSDLSTIRMFPCRGSIVTSHMLHGKHGLADSVFDPTDISRFLSPQQLLNDVCINGGAALLQHIFSSSGGHTAKASERCAILSTFDLPKVRYRCSDQELWRHIRRSSYWMKDIWILPIHRPSPESHWVLCFMSLMTQEIFLFDSLAGPERSWKHDIKDIRSLVDRMTLLANHHGHAIQLKPDGWIARPVSIHPLQSNTYDCGVWVLAAIAAVLRGYHVTGCAEEDLSFFRQFFAHYILTLPVQSFK